MDVNAIIASAFNEQPDQTTTEAAPDAEPVATDETAETTGEADPEAEPEATETDPENPPAVITDIWADIDAKLASDDPEEVKAARDLLLDVRRKVGKSFRAVEKREGKLKGKIAALHADRDVVLSQLEVARSYGKAIRSGDAKAILKALADATGEDPVKIYTDMSLAMATNGKKAPDAEVRAELEALRAELKADKESKAQAEAQAAEQDAQRQFLTLSSDDGKFPHLAGFSKTEPEAVIRAAIETRDELAESGQTPTLEAIAKAMEAALTERLGAHTAGRTPGAQKAKSEPSRSAHPTRSLSPRLREQAASGPTQPKTTDERLKELAQDKNFWARTGLPGM